MPYLLPRIHRSLACSCLLSSATSCSRLGRAENSRLPGLIYMNMYNPRRKVRFEILE